MIRFSFLMFICLLILPSCKKKVEKVEEVFRPVRYGEVVLTGGGETHTFSGTAQSSKEAKLSFRVAGTIRSLNVNVGDRVRKGQQIASLDASDYTIQYDQSLAQQKSTETQIKSAQSQLLTTKSTYERVEKLYENNSVPLSEFESAKAAYEAAQSQYDAAVAQATASEKQVQASRNQVNYARLTAPFSGVITMIDVEENEIVGSGTPIALLTSEQKPEVSLGVPEIFIGQITQGQDVEVRFSVLTDQVFEGEISEVGFSSGSTSTYPITVQLKNANNAIRPGMAANVTFTTTEKKPTGQETLIAPVKAVGDGPEGNFVFLLEKSERADIYTVKRQNVSIGTLTPSGFEIKEGLSKGDLVATAGHRTLLNGMEVRLLD
ncbi:MAG: efflux RND transporter periplasmic adaptor subunit [Bacteroidota bacterium]